MVLGYTISDLRQHIESLFTAGMTWEVFNSGAIHLDHKIAKSKFTFTSVNDIDFKACWALHNLQPMWAIDNFRKKNKSTEPTPAAATN